MDVDYIIVGQGIAGSLIGYDLINSNKEVLVFSDETQLSSSEVAGGMFNPVTGKHLSKTWLADTLFPYMFSYYESIEKRFDVKFVHHNTIYRPFANENQQAQFLKILNENALDEYLQVVPPNEVYEAFIKNPLGGLQTSASGWVDMSVFLATFKSFFQEKNSFRSEEFDYNALVVNSNSLVYKDIKAKGIIFCEGFYVKDNPYFGWLPMNPVKGETLIVEMPTYAVSEIVNQGSWVLPMGLAQYRFGATYSWHTLDFEPTEDGRNYLLSKITKFLKTPYEIKAQKAGVRPATKDRRPIMGSHPKHKNLFVFNGLGTKGVSLGPYFSSEMCEFLLSGKEINPETTIERFYSLY